MLNNLNHQRISIQYPVLDHEESIANIALEIVAINCDNASITIEDVLDTHRNNMFLVIENKGNAVSLLTVKAGDAYPNSMLGDTCIELRPGFSAINLADLPRFVRADNSIDIEFHEDFVGKLFVIGKYKFKENEKVDW